MRRRTVGVLSDDDGLFVDLALRRERLDVHRVHELAEMAGHDVALVEVPQGEDAAAWVATVPIGPAIVLLTDDATPVEGATVVRRPCSLEGLADVLVGAVPGRSGGVVLTVDAPAPTMVDQDPAGGGISVSDQPSDDRWDRRVLDALLHTTSTAPFADAAATAVGEEIGADHVALWQFDGDAYTVLGAVGLSEGARRMRLASTHPVVQLAHANDGILHRGLEDPGARAPGLPGSGSATYAMVLVEGGPVAAATLSGRDLTAADADRMRGFVHELADRWPVAR